MRTSRREMTWTDKAPHSLPRWFNPSHLGLPSQPLSDKNKKLLFKFKKKGAVDIVNWMVEKRKKENKHLLINNSPRSSRVYFSSWRTKPSGEPRASSRHVRDMSVDRRGRELQLRLALESFLTSACQTNSKKIKSCVNKDRWKGIYISAYYPSQAIFLRRLPSVQHQVSHLIKTSCSMGTQWYP